MSRQTRGWNYDYLVFDAFHNVGQGDLEYEIVSKTRTEGFEIVRVKVNDPPSTIFIETQLKGMWCKKCVPSLLPGAEATIRILKDDVLPWTLVKS